MTSRSTSVTRSVSGRDRRLVAMLDITFGAIAVSENPAATVSARWWHHRKQQNRRLNGGSDLQDPLLARLVELTGVSLM
jgi:hypothetical protein